MFISAFSGWIYEMIFWAVPVKLVFKWMSQDPISDKSNLFSVMTWCRQATIHCLNPSWPRAMTPYSVTRANKLRGIFLNKSLRLQILLLNIILWEVRLFIMHIYIILTVSIEVYYYLIIFVCFNFSSRIDLSWFQYFERPFPIDHHLVIHCYFIV